MVLPLLARLTAPPTQTLHTLRPTPSTISLTVSTRPVRTTLAAKLVHYVAVLTRVLLGVSTLFVVWTKYQLSAGQTADISLWLLGGPTTTRFLRALGLAGWTYVVPGSLLVLFLVLRRGYTEESLTAIQGLGLQTSTSAPTFLQSPRVRFIPSTQIQDILIHEAFLGFEVRFYLAVVVKGEQDVVVVFPGLLPRRNMLEEVWRGVRGCLWEGGMKSGRGSGEKEGELG